MGKALADKVVDACRRLLPRGGRVLVAVSGGADSVALLRCLHERAGELGISLAAAHLNHGLRGGASDGDAAFVGRLAARLGIPLVEEKADVRRRAKEQGASLEMAARDARYEFFARAARTVGARAVATAHTADDNVETVLLRLARGTGLAGLCGIPRVATQNGLRIVRPMLEVTRGDVLRFLRARRATWREDASNDDMAFLRNRVRHEILPLLARRLNPRIGEAILRMTDVLREEDEWMDRLCRPLAGRALRADGGLTVRTLRGQPAAARRRVLRQWLLAAGVPVPGVDFDAVRRADGLLQSDRRAGRADAGGGWRVARRGAVLYVGNPLATSADAAVEAVLNVPGETVLPGIGLRVAVRVGRGIKRGHGSVGRLPAEGSVSARAVGDKPLVLRFWRDGDRMKPLGMKGTKKLQDIFTDAKIPPAERRQMPLLECGGEIVWIPGYRVARGWQVAGEDGPALHLRVRRK
jgi:tRNA(Ile)-lysidine synthase